VRTRMEWNLQANTCNNASTNTKSNTPQSI